MTHGLRSTTAQRLTGGCQCGKVLYEVADEFKYALHCHCSICRRVTGAAFKTIAGIEREKLHLISRSDHVWTIGADGWYDVRCDTCGSFLYSIVREGSFAHIALGTLFDDPTIRPQAHIFVGSKAPWFDITDDLPQYAEHLTPGA